jgi:hypothetical protein
VVGGEGGCNHDGGLSDYNTESLFVDHNR